MKTIQVKQSRDSGDLLTVMIRRISSSKMPFCRYSLYEGSDGKYYEKYRFKGRKAEWKIRRKSTIKKSLLDGEE